MDKKKIIRNIIIGALLVMMIIPTFATLLISLLGA